MIHHTKAYGNFRKQTIDLLNFIVAVFYAIPSLKLRIKNIKNDTLVTPRPEYFTHDKSSPEMVRRLTFKYKLRLGAYSLLSIFSFFEAYVKDVLEEIIDFHGGEKVFLELSLNKSQKYIVNIPNEIKNNKRKLIEYLRPQQKDKYEKHTKILKQLEYNFPTTLFAPYGINAFLEKVKYIRAIEIPEILNKALHITLTEDQINQFDSIRKIRNDIAHGRKVTYSMKKVMEIHKYLRDLALLIDKHIIEHYLVIEKYV